MRIGFVVLLFVIAGVDQLHFYWANRVDRLDALQRAAALNPDDSGVQLRLAHAAALAGKVDTRLDALRHAARVNPGDLNVQENLARGLIESGKTIEASAQYRLILERWPRNAEALVNGGILAQQLGHDGELSLIHI